VKLKRKISNQEFETARTTHIKTFIYNISKVYSSLSSDTRNAAGDVALWRCLQSHDPKYGSRFTTSLYRFVQWECKRAMKEQIVTDVTLFGEVKDDNETLAIHMLLDDYLCLLGERDRRIVEAKFLENYTLDEIARTEGLSKQGIKNIVDRSILIMSEATKTV